MSETAFYFLCGLVGLYTGLVLASLVRELAGTEWSAEPTVTDRLAADFVGEVTKYVRDREV